MVRGRIELPTHGFSVRGPIVATYHRVKSFGKPLEPRCRQWCREIWKWVLGAENVYLACGHAFFSPFESEPDSFGRASLIGRQKGGLPSDGHPRCSRWISNMGVKACITSFTEPCIGRTT